MSELETVANGSTEKGLFGKGFFEKLANGDFGLAKTYWVYWVLVNVVVTIIANAITSIGGLVILIGGLVILMLAYTAYQIPVILGVWRAANKYQGSKIWAILAKIVVVLGAIMLAVGLLMIISMLHLMGLLS